MHDNIHIKTRVDLQFERFFKRHFESPKKCRNVDQVRFYLGEINRKIEEYRENYNYVPARAEQLLSSYQRLYNRMVHSDFVK